MKQLMSFWIGLVILLAAILTAEAQGISTGSPSLGAPTLGINPTPSPPSRHDYSHHRGDRGTTHPVPGPLVGAGLPFLIFAGGVWLYRRVRRS